MFPRLERAQKNLGVKTLGIIITFVAKILLTLFYYLNELLLSTINLKHTQYLGFKDKIVTFFVRSRTIMYVTKCIILLFSTDIYGNKLLYRRKIFGFGSQM